MNAGFMAAVTNNGIRRFDLRSQTKREIGKTCFSSEEWTKEKYYGILLTSVRIHIYLVPVAFPRRNWKQLLTIHIMKINGKSCVPF